MIDKEYLDNLHPNWKNGELYTDGLFLKTSKDKKLKSIMINLRVYYSKTSGKTASCFCARGIRIIIEWLIKKVKEDENKTKE